MPLKRCESDGTQGWKWGDRGKCYTGENAKDQAIAQAMAIGDGEFPETKKGETMNVFEQFVEFWAKKADEIEEVTSEKSDQEDNNEETTPEEDNNLEKLVELAKNEGVGPRGGEDPRVAFIGASPSKVDVIRGKTFAGKINKVVEDHYLQHLNLDKEEVVFMNLVPVYKEDENGSPREPTPEEIREWAPLFKRQLKEAGPEILVALGTAARDGLEDIFGRKFDESIDEFVPHPRAIAIHGDSGEIARKFARLNKMLDKIEGASLTKSEDHPVRITKTNDELQVVKGIVLEPGVEDSDGNWSTRSEIEKTAHDFLMNSDMVVGREHLEKMDNAFIVESHIQEEDTVINGEPVKAGSWLVGVKINDPEEWEMVKSGKYGGFSIGASANIAPSLRLE